MNTKRFPEFTVAFSSANSYSFAARGHSFKVSQCGDMEWNLSFENSLGDQGALYQVSYQWDGAGNPVKVYHHIFLKAMELRNSDETYFLLNEGEHGWAYLNIEELV